MATKYRFFLIMFIVSMLIGSCGGGAAPTEPPAATQMPNIQQPSDSNLVVILVVDTFSKPEAPSEVTPTPEIKQGNCSVTADGQKATGHESATITLDGPHGIFVYTDLISRPEISPTAIAAGLVNKVSDGEDFTTTNLRIRGQEYTWIKRYDLYEFSEEKKLLVIAVDTDGLNLNSIENNISTALEEMSTNDILLGDQSLSPTKRFVVNMSFVLIPCDPRVVLGKDMDVEAIREKYKTDYDTIINENAPLANLRKRLEDLYSVDTLNTLQPSFSEVYPSIDINQLPLTEEEVKALEPPLASVYPFDISQLLILDEDQKTALIDEAIFRAYIVYLIYDPTQDRNWQYDKFYDILKSFSVKDLEIVYVGAAGNFSQKFSFAPASWDFVDSISSEAADYSNWGEIQMNGVHPFSNKIVGTSFAAPKFSYQIAHYLLLEGGKSPCTNSEPALGYATTKDPWATATPDTSGSTAPEIIADNNLPFAVAIPTYCP